jgi:hypothetical protein
MAARRHNARDQPDHARAADAGPLSPLVQNLRDVADDVDHGIRQRRFVGDADALARALNSAAEAGVPKRAIEELATRHFRLLIDDAARHTRRPWARGRRLGSPAGEPPEQLPSPRQGRQPRLLEGPE